MICEDDADVVGSLFGIEILIYDQVDAAGIINRLDWFELCCFYLNLNLIMAYNPLTSSAHSMSK